MLHGPDFNSDTGPGEVPAVESAAPDFMQIAGQVPDATGLPPEASQTNEVDDFVPLSRPAPTDEKMNRCMPGTTGHAQSELNVDTYGAIALEDENVPEEKPGPTAVPVAHVAEAQTGSTGEATKEQRGLQVRQDTTPSRPQAESGGSMAPPGGGGGDNQSSGMSFPEDGNDNEPEDRDLKPEITESAEQKVDKTNKNEGVAIERITVGKTQVTVVLCEHREENAPDIAAALKEGDIVAFEAAGTLDAEDRARYTEFANGIMAKDAPPGIVDQALLIFDPTFGAILSEMRDTDKTAVLLDISEDHPDFPLHLQSVESQGAYVDKLRAMTSFEEAQEAFSAHARDCVKEGIAREAIVTEQLQELFNRTNQKEPTPSVSIVLGATHYRAIAPFRENSESTCPPDVQKVIHAGFHEQAMEEIRNGNTERADALAQRAVVAAYVGLELRSTLDVDGINAFVARFSHDLVETAAGQFKEVLADSRLSRIGKMVKVMETARTVISQHAADETPDPLSVENN